MSVHYEPARDRYVVRWREGGRNRSRRFGGTEEAETFDQGLRTPAALIPDPVDTRAGGDGIYAYHTKAGARFRFLFRQSDGSISTRRGFTSRRAAATARRRLVESIERGEVKFARETFGEFWIRFVEERRPYLTAGSMVDLETHGRKRGRRSLRPDRHRHRIRDGDLRAGARPQAPASEPARLHGDPGGDMTPLRIAVRSDELTVAAALAGVAATVGKGETVDTPRERNR